MKLELSQSDARIISAVAVAASKDLARPILTGILLESDGTVVATDSYRLAYAECSGLGGNGTTKECDRLIESPVILPAAEIAKALAPVCKGSSSSHVPSILTVEDWDWQLTVGGTTTTGRTIGGTFPDWRGLVPGMTGGSFSSPALPETVDQSKGYVSAFSPFYLADLAKIATILAGSAKEAKTGGWAVRMGCADDSKPAVFKLHELTYLLMPVRVR